MSLVIFIFAAREYDDPSTLFFCTHILMGEGIVLNENMDVGSGCWPQCLSHTLSTNKGNKLNLLFQLEDTNGFDTYSIN